MVLEMMIKEGMFSVKQLACPLVLPTQATCCHPAIQNCDKPLISELWCLAVRLIRNSPNNALSYLVVVILIILKVLMIILIIILLVLIKVLVILEVVLVDRFSVAVPFGASSPAHVSGAYLSTDSGECQACGPLRTTIDIGSVSHEECLLQ